MNLRERIWGEDGWSEKAQGVMLVVWHVVWPAAVILALIGWLVLWAITGRKP